MWPLKHDFESKFISKYTENLTCGTSFCNIIDCKIPTWIKLVAEGGSGSVGGGGSVTYRWN